MRKRQQSWRDRMGSGRLSRVWIYSVLFAGALCVALALNLFLIPNRIAAGGVSGLATVVFHLFGLPVGVTMLLVNLPLFAASLKVLGRRFGIKTLFGAVATALLVDATAPLTIPLTTDPALAAVYGGVLAGVGVGLTFRVGGSTGGTDMAAQLLHRWLHLGAGRMLLLVDGFVILLAAFAFSAELALYALLSAFLTSKVIDLMQEGHSYAKAAFIISERVDEIARRVLAEMDRGATTLQGRGMYTGMDRQVLFVIVARGEIVQLRRLVVDADPRAFVVVTDVFEVLGEGFGPMQAGSPGGTQS